MVQGERIRMKREAMGTNVDPGIIARASGALRGAINGWRQAWFGPLSPLPEVVPADQRDTVVGRGFDYPIGFNTRITPRGEEPVSFAQMRALADGYDLMRIIIETRKDQVCKLKWKIAPIDDKKKPDDRCTKITDFFRLPDKEHTWDDWLRMLLEDLLVIDAPTAYPRLTVGGDLYALEPMDGALIKRVLDDKGRTPIAPNPAYQQILKGLPAVNYTRDELIYSPRNLRTHKIYGYSPVEQVIMTVNIALRRQIYQLNYYTEGNIPDAIASVPKEWNPDQIAQFQAYWDSLIEGNLAQRRKMIFVPDGNKYQQTKEPVLKDVYDEWLARIICFAFSIEPTPFVAQVNRAVAETSREQSLSEGLAPIQNWIRNLINFVIIKFFDAPDLNFVWDTEEAIDPLVKAQIDKIYVDAKVLHPDEVRADLGRDPLTDEQKEDLNPQPLMGADDGAIDETQPGNKKPKTADAKEAFAKAKKFVAPEEKPLVAKNIKALKKSLTKFFDDQAPKIAAQLINALDITKAEEADDKIGETRRKEKVDNAIAALNFDEWADELPDELETYLTAVAVDAGGEALESLDIDSDDVDELMRKRAESFAHDRTAEMVGKKWIDGDLVDNPNAQWVITDGTREMLRATTEQALDEGWSAQKFAAEVAENHAFSADRADTIARTELAFADIAGNAEGWKASGVVSGMQFLAAPDCCDECQARDGDIVSLDDLENAAPLHPRCRCNMVAVLDDES